MNHPVDPQNKQMANASRIDVIYNTALREIQFFALGKLSEIGNNEVAVIHVHRGLRNLKASFIS